MSDGKEVKRWIIEKELVQIADLNYEAYLVARGEWPDEPTQVMPVTDHDRIVAELKANLSTCQSILQGAFNVQTDLKEEIEALKEKIIGYQDEIGVTRAFDSRDTTIATQARVIDIAKRVLHNAGLRPPDGGTPTVETICEDLNDAIMELAAIEKEGEKDG